MLFEKCDVNKKIKFCDDFDLLKYHISVKYHCKYDNIILYEINYIDKNIFYLFTKGIDKLDDKIIHTIFYTEYCKFIDVTGKNQEVISKNIYNAVKKAYIKYINNIIYENRSDIELKNDIKKDMLNNESSHNIYLSILMHGGNLFLKLKIWKK